MHRRTLIGSSLALTGLAACTTSAPTAGTPPSVGAGDGRFPELAGLKLRVVRPGEMMTMDYNPDRLTIVVDEQNRIESARIG